MSEIKIINYDSIVGEDSRMSNIQMIKIPNSMCIIAPRASGKTNLLLNLLIGSGNGPLIYYDKIYIFSPTKQQNKYKFLIEYFNMVDEMIKDNMKKTKNKYEDGKTLTITNDYNLLPQIESDDKKTKTQNKINKLVIMDDAITLMNRDKTFYSLVEKYYVLGRHQFITPCFLSQSYTELEPIIRTNSLLNIFMGYPTRNLLMDISRYFPIMDYKGWKQCFNENINSSFDFILIDSQEPDINKKVWSNNLNNAVDVKTIILNNM